MQWRREKDEILYVDRFHLVTVGGSTSKRTKRPYDVRGSNSSSSSKKCSGNDGWLRNTAGREVSNGERRD